MEFTYWDILRNLLLATRWTLVLAVMAFAGGAVAGLAVLLLRMSHVTPVRTFMKGYIAVFQGTPLLMQLFLVFFGLPRLGVTLEPFGVAAVALTLSSSAYLAEIWRGGVEAIPEGQWDAAASLGLRPWQQYWLIVLPQAFYITRSPTVGFLVLLVKSTALTSIIGFDELMKTANSITNATFSPTEVYGSAVLIYFAICYPMSLYVRRLEKQSA